MFKIYKNSDLGALEFSVRNYFPMELERQFQSISSCWKYCITTVWF